MSEYSDGSSKFVDARPVDVAILYGQGQKDRAQLLAKRVHVVRHVGLVEKDE